MARTRKSPQADKNAVKQTAQAEENTGQVIALPKKQRERTSEEAVQRMIELRKERKGLPTISNTLNAEGIKTATGKEFRPQTVRQILLRHNAMGESVVKAAAEAAAKDN